eukprot:8021532-Alexandrium_andersonii.AAC.1
MESAPARARGLEEELHGQSPPPPSLGPPVPAGPGSRGWPPPSGSAQARPCELPSAACRAPSCPRATGG